MIYFANPTPESIKHMQTGELGYIATPGQGSPQGDGKYARPTGVVWCADNGCFGKNFNEASWWRWLESNASGAAECVFATAPDVVGDHAATVERSRPWLPRIRALGYPAAFVAQDGATPNNMPWNEFDALFIGGSTDFKLSQTAVDIAVEAKRRGMWVHVGRVNSRRRFLRFTSVADSADGTCLVFGSRVRLPEVLGWVREHRLRMPLWEEA